MKSEPFTVASIHSLGVRIALALVLLVVTIGLVNYAYHSRVAEENIISDTASDLSDALALLQTSMQQTMRDGDLTQAQAELAALGADPNVRAAVLVDADRRIIASSRRAWLGEHFDVAAATAPDMADEWSALTSTIQGDRRGDVRIDDERNFLIGAYPVRLQQRRATPRPTEYGFIAVTYDMRLRKEAAANMVASQTGFFTTFIIVTAIVLWAAARVLITTRVQRLTQTAGQLAAGNLRARVRLSGTDELAALGRAFDRMAQKIAQHQNRLYEHERQLRSLLESTAEGIIGIDHRGQCTFCNPTAATALGFDNSLALLRKDVAGFFGAPPKQDETAFRAEFFQALEDGRKLYLPEIPLKRRQGSPITVSLRVYPMEQDGRTSGAVATFIDVTEQHQTTRTLAKASVVFEHSAEAIVVTDRNGTVEQSNRAYTKLTGIPSEKALNRPLGQLLKWDSLESTVWHSAETTGTWQGEIWQTRSDGSVFPSWTTVSRVINGQQEVTNFIVMFTDITEKKNWEAHIEHLAYYDALTNLPNRRLFGDRLKHAIERAKRRQSKVAVLFADLDRFKNINDSLGHSVGDRLLQEVARRLTEHVREQDTVARLGGDEFTVLLDDLHSDDEPVIVGEKILDAMNQPFHLDGHELHIGASIGISLFPDDATLAEDITKHADVAMYLAKQQGRNRLLRFDETQGNHSEQRRVMESELRDALAQHQLSLHYQPQIDLANGQIVAVEALARWQHPEQGYIPPPEFLALAEGSDLSDDIGEWLIDSVCRQIAQWQRRGQEALPIAVNLSPSQVGDEEFLLRIKGKIDEYGVDGSALQLEIGEDTLTSAPARSKRALQALRDVGIRIVVDDYGIGSGGLEQFHDMPIDRLKINRGFAQGLPHDRHTASVISSIVALAHALRVDVIAKGVERQSQAAYLKQARCDAAQGFLYYRPMPADQLDRVIRDKKPRAAKKENTSIN